MIRRLLFGLSVALSFNAFSQREISGIVRSGDDDMPLPGVSIQVKGTSRGTITNAEGGFQIVLNGSEETLIFSFVGYKGQEVTVGQRSSLDVVLEPEATALDEVVVIGYGQVVKKSDLTGSVGSVRSKDLVTVPAATAMQALQGKVAGVQISSVSGAPGAGVVVRVRGIGTVNNAGPLFVVDGIFTDDIDFLNPADIESVEVLKDASATAIYGSRGANGVFLITTKKGSATKEGTTITAMADLSIQNLADRIDLLSGREFATVVNEIAPGSFNNVDAVPNTNWQDLIFQSAPISNYQVSVANSSAKAQTYFSVGYFKQGGIIDKSEFERATIKLNTTLALAPSVRLGTNLTFTPSRQQNTFGGAVFNVYRAQPTITPFQPDGSFSPVPGVGNVLADIEYTNNFESSVRGLGNAFVEVDFLKDLTFKTSFGIDANYAKARSFTPEFFVSTLQQNPINDLNKAWRDRFFWLWENTVNYNKEIGRHRISAVVGYTSQSGSSESANVGAENILRDDEDFWFINPNNINPNIVSNGVDFNFNFSMVSYLGRINYTFDDRFLFTASFRRDGSSKFAQGNRYGNFPSLALGWNLINEEFLAGQKLFSNLKLRASWGVIGNEKIAYDRQYSRVLNGINAVFGTDGGLVPGSTFGVSGNPDLVWESAEQINLGAELGFLNDRLSVEVDYYNRRTKDILIALPVPGYLGNGDGAAITFNTGEVLNRGIELTLGFTGEVRGLGYRIYGNGTTIHNEMTRISGTEGPGDFIQNATGTTRTFVGDPIGSFFGYRVIGVFQNQADLDSYPHRSDAGIGDLKYEDVNGDNILDANDRTTIGSPIPSFLFGFGTELTYRNFDLSFDFQGQLGNEIYNQKETIRPDLYNFEQRVFSRWTGEGTSNAEPRATAGGYNFLPSTRFIQNGSFLRLRTLTLGYSLPSKIASAIKARQARVYARATNLFTIRKFTGYSPELGAADVINANIDFGSYPIPTVYSTGVSLTF